MRAASTLTPATPRALAPSFLSGFHLLEPALLGMAAHFPASLYPACGVSRWKQPGCSTLQVEALAFYPLGGCSGRVVGSKASPSPSLFASSFPSRSTQKLLGKDPFPGQPGSANRDVCWKVEGLGVGKRGCLFRKDVILGMWRPQTGNPFTLRADLRAKATLVASRMSSNHVYRAEMAPATAAWGGQVGKA